MINNEVALKYSKALFELGKEKDSLLLFQKELNQVWDLIENNGEFRQAFFHKRILPTDKKAIIKELFTGETSEYTLNFINLLIDNRREENIESIIDNFKTLVNREEAIVEVEVITAVELGDDLEAQLKDKLNQLLDYEVVVYPKTDPKIIGGMVLKFNDFIVDGSIKRGLTKLEEDIKSVPSSMLGV
ncbi:F0F1 ATP synthase subunit delta [Iocasia frigidifontis]|uniref:ATP synthase subunit delta n=1 Tax=Iocasia fonsfrigidae TaxID=2682810 RepID=A0A8A7K6S3_9FIRM|nr:ATP synthase F1 subunit delta [Iocasia fonsfrigidae]QTL96870.1 F0F1 ATP synthase subunit delta [Iocasia fonsfrigidae]